MAASELIAEPSVEQHSQQEATFNPDPKVAMGQQIAFGIIGLVLAMIAHYIKTRESFLKSAAIGLAAGAAVTAFFILKNRKRGYASLHFGGESLTIEDNLGRTVLPWNEVKKAVHYLHGEERWEFHIEGHREPVKYPLYGFLPPQLNEIQAALQKRVTCFQERTPMEGQRPLAA